MSLLSEREKLIKPENKALLWNLMYEGGIFKGIASNYIKNVQKDFEKKIESIQQKAKTSSTLTQLNKIIISEMMTDLNKYRAQSTTQSSTTNIPITSEELSKQNQHKFQNNLEKRQNDFTNLMQTKKPERIDFSDDLDKPIGSEMDNMLADAIKKRENELNVVLDHQDTTAAEEWINKDGTIKSNTQTQEQSRHIKIGNETALNNENIIDISPKNQTPAILSKQVTFQELTPITSDNSSFEMEGFLSKLKSKSPSAPQQAPQPAPQQAFQEQFDLLNKRLENIEKIQQEMLDILKKNITQEE